MVAAFDDLEPGERAEMKKHLDVCPSCRARFETFQHVDRLFDRKGDDFSGDHPSSDELLHDPLPLDVATHLKGCAECTELHRILVGLEEEEERFGRMPGPEKADRAREGAERIGAVFIDPVERRTKKGILQPFFRKPLVTGLTLAAATILVVIGLQFSPDPEGLSFFSDVRIEFTGDDASRSARTDDTKPDPEWTAGTAKVEAGKGFRLHFATLVDSWVYSFHQNDDGGFEILEDAVHAEAGRWIPIPNWIEDYGLESPPGKREAIVLVALSERLEGDALKQVAPLLTEQWTRNHGDRFLEHDLPEDEARAGRLLEKDLAEAIASKLLEDGSGSVVSVHVQKLVTIAAKK